MIITPEEIESFYTVLVEYQCKLCKQHFPNKEHKLKHLEQTHKFEEIANELNLQVVGF